MFAAAAAQWLRARMSTSGRSRAIPKRRRGEPRTPLGLTGPTGPSHLSCIREAPTACPLPGLRCGAPPRSLGLVPSSFSTGCRRRSRRASVSVRDPARGGRCGRAEPHQAAPARSVARAARSTFPRTRLRADRAPGLVGAAETNGFAWLGERVDELLADGAARARWTRYRVPSELGSASCVGLPLDAGRALPDHLQAPPVLLRIRRAGVASPRAGARQSPAGWRLLRCNPWSHGGFDPVR
jgi:hypothetical protein